MNNNVFSIALIVGRVVGKRIVEDEENFNLRKQGLQSRTCGGGNRGNDFSTMVTVAWSMDGVGHLLLNAQVLLLLVLLVHLQAPLSWVDPLHLSLTMSIDTSSHWLNWLVWMEAMVFLIAGDIPILTPCGCMFLPFPMLMEQPQLWQVLQSD